MNAAGELVDRLPANPVGILYAWWRDDPLPDLQVPDGLTIEREPGIELLQAVSALSKGEIDKRFRHGNSALAARIAGAPAGIGWSSAERVEIGELGLNFDLPPGNRYLWDFVTLPGWRGQGVYPLLLQAFIRQDVEAERFWVGHDLGNVASARGIEKAGFLTVGEVYDVPGAGPVFVAEGSDGEERAEAAASLLAIPYLHRKR